MANSACCDNSHATVYERSGRALVDVEAPILFPSRTRRHRELPARGYLVVLAVEAAVAVVSAVTAAPGPRLPFGEFAGWWGLGSMVAMQLYSVRRRVPALRRLGALRTWLDWHIFMGVQGGIFITYHGFRVTNWSSAAGIGLALMWLVLGSGLFGRYLFSRVPRTLTGEVLAARALDRELAVLGEELAARLPEPLDLALPELARDAGVAATRAHGREVRAQIRRVSCALAHLPDAAHLIEVARRRARLARRRPRIAAAERVLRAWLTLHRPITIALGTLAMLHVIAHFAYRALP